MRNAIRLLLATASLFIFICLVGSKQASAATGNYTCTPVGGKQITSVVWDGNGFYIRCGGTNLVFYAKKGATCAGSAEGTTSFDSIKIWQGLVTTAYLAGKGISIAWNDACADAGGGWNYITAISLQAP
jgi:hypothetical protein